MGDRYPRVSRGGDGGRDAGHDLELDPRVGQRERLLASPSEHKRVAAFQPHDRRPGAGPLDQQSVNLVLRQRVVGRLFAGVDVLGALRRQVQEARRDEVVIHDHVGAREAVTAAKGQKARVAGPGADQIDASVAHERSPSLPL